MRPTILIFAFVVMLFSCTSRTSAPSPPYTKDDILTNLESLEPYKGFPMFDHPYVYTSGSRVTLFADENRWAIVFEKTGYGEGQTLEVVTFGNCLINQSKQGSQGQFLSNASYFSLVPIEELKRIQNGTLEEMSELVSPDAKQIAVRGKLLPIEHSKETYSQIGIPFRDYDNPKGLVDFPSLFRYLNEKYPEIFSAQDNELRSLLPRDIPKLLVIKEWHHRPFFQLYEGAEAKPVLHGETPSSYETYPMMADVLVTKDTTRWKPTLKPNTNWRNWPRAGSM